MAASKDNDQVQKQGLCELSYDIATPLALKAKSHKMDFQLIRKIVSLRDALPIKTASRHIVSDDPLMEIIAKIAHPFMNLHTTVRTRFHAGKPTEASQGERNQKMLTKCLFLMLYPCWFVSFKFLTFCTLGSHVAVQYALLSYGIPVEALPIDARTGHYHNRAQKVWLQHRRSVEAAAKKQLSEPVQRQRQGTQSSIAHTVNNITSSNVHLKPKLKSEATGEPLDTTVILQPGPNDGT